MTSERKLRELLLEALALKDLPRAGWLRAGVAQPESVAAHSWGVAWLVLALCPTGLDRGHALALAVLHDLAEVRIGDLTPHDGVHPAVKRASERQALRDLLSDLPSGRELLALWEEGEARRSDEARFVRACDKLDMALQAARYAAQGEGGDLQEFVDSALAELEQEELRILADENRDSPLDAG